MDRQKIISPATSFMGYTEDGKDASTCTTYYSIFTAL